MYLKLNQIHSLSIQIDFVTTEGTIIFRYQIYKSKMMDFNFFSFDDKR